LFGRGRRRGRGHSPVMSAYFAAENAPKCTVSRAKFPLVVKLPPPSLLTGFNH